MKRSYLYGGTDNQERLDLLSHFQNDDQMNVLFISKVGDNSIDLPDVNVIIQVSSHFSSRRQEAQRLGRILRPKPVSEGYHNAFFYSLVSQDTKEMYYATKRQRFLVDQGYSFTVIKDLDSMSFGLDGGGGKGVSYKTHKQQTELLAEIMAAEEASARIEQLELDVVNQENKKKKKKKRNWGRMVGSGEAVRRPKHTLFQKRRKEKNQIRKNKSK